MIKERSFNVAATFALRKFIGNPSLINKYRCFNVAATFALRKLNIHSENSRIVHSFNVAATFALRKCINSFFNAPKCSLLQCGRNFCVAEIVFHPECARKLNIASMWPQLLRCGNLHPPGRYLRIPAASMWPQLLRCGNLLVTEGCPDVRRVLQCGRNFCVAEMAKSEMGDTSDKTASMWPQLLRCGNPAAVTPPPPPATMLQCGRNFCVAEIAGEYLYRTSQNLLQCGRNFCVAEIIQCRHLIWRQCFRLQCGRNFCVAEIRHNGWDSSSGDVLQCGRNFCVAEIVNLHTLEITTMISFNVAATFALRKFTL